MTTKGMTRGLITDEELARVRSRMGSIYRPYRYNEVATRDAIRHFADGIGDDNPLWRDESYARYTRYGGIIAPPGFLYSVSWFGPGQGFPGVHGFNSGDDWEFFRPTFVNDTITIQACLSKMVEKPSKFAGRTVIQYFSGIYRNQRGETVAKLTTWTIRAERIAAREKGKYSDIGKYPYTPEELKAIEDAYEAEQIRGANPRYWEDVNVGDQLAPVVKGPLNLSDMHAFIAGTLGGAAGGRGGAHKFALQYRKRHPGWAYVDPDTGAVDTPEQVHASGALSAEVGVPLAYDYGCQRMSWLSHLLTNWMGDDSFLKKLYGEIRMFNMLGDTTWFKGKVVRKYVENEEHLVDIECWGENQRGQITLPGRATVILPSRG